MRKILEERLENAKLDYQRCFEEIDYPYYKNDELKGQVMAYQDCLNLIPAPRTEQEILKDFEKLEYKVELSRYFVTILYLNKPIITISRLHKLYCISNFELSMQEHKLLNELFTLWGWI